MALTPARKTYPQLTAATDVQDGDLLATYRSTGPLKKLTASAARTYMQANLGTMATQNANSVAITGGSITGVTGLLNVSSFSSTNSDAIICTQEASGGDDTSALNAAIAANPGRPLFGYGTTFSTNANLSPGLILNDGFLIDTRYNSGTTPADDFGVTAVGWRAAASNVYEPGVFPASGGRFFAAGNCIVAFGYKALEANTTGRRQAAFGYRALLSNTTGYYNTALGSHTLESCSTGYQNTAVGVQALQAVNTGYDNTAVGSGAGVSLQTGLRNTAGGSESLRGTTNGGDNAAWGYQALGALSAGGMSQNVGVGSFAGKSLTGNDNVMIGYRAGQDASATARNTGIGKDALVSLTLGADNTALGNQTAQNITTHNNVVAVGSLAMATATVGDTVAVGYQALQSLTTGIQNTAIGYRALSSLTTGGNNAAFGHDSLRVCTGDNNNAFGRAAGASLTTGSNNTLFGQSAGASLTTHDLNVAIGHQALSNNTSGQNTAIGPQCFTNTNSFANCTAIGYQAEPTKNNQVVIGNASVVETVLRGVLRANTTYTVAGLPLVADAGAGARAFVTDANATTFAAIVAGGGANGVPVYCDGTNWRIG